MTADPYASAEEIAQALADAEILIADLLDDRRNWKGVVEEVVLDRWDKRIAEVVLLRERTRYLLGLRLAHDLGNRWLDG